MESIAQTNIQLYNQLRHQGRSPDELALVKRCYQLAVSLYSGNFQADGKPFVAHSVGVASVVAQLGLPAEIVGARAFTTSTAMAISETLSFTLPRRAAGAL